MEPLKLYLAGGLNSNWQSKVIEKFDDQFIYFNPLDHNLDKGIEYTEWDLFYVRKADIVFAYMEKDNPSGIGLSLEVGFAKALNKTIILVDEKSSHDSFFADRLKIVKATASIAFDNLADGMTYLETFLRVSKSNPHVSNRQHSYAE